MITSKPAAGFGRHPRFVHTCFQNYLRQLGVPAPIRKAYAGWLTRFLVFHHGQALDVLQSRHVDHFMHFLQTYGEFTDEQLHQALCCLRMFYQCFLPEFQQQDDLEIQLSG